MLRKIIIAIIINGVLLCESVTVIAVTVQESGYLKRQDTGGIVNFQVSGNVSNSSGSFVENGHSYSYSIVYTQSGVSSGSVVPGKLVVTTKCNMHNVTRSETYVAVEQFLGEGLIDVGIGVDHVYKTVDRYRLDITYEISAPNCSGGDDDDDDDDDDDPPPECTCGACCQCKCTCGNWSGKSCVGACGHAVPNPGEYATCECHHVDPPDEGCCEHHKKDFKPPPDIPGIGAFNDPGILQPPTFNMTLGNGGFSIPQNPGNAQFPESFNGSLPSLEGVGGVETKPLEYFERQGEYELPKFKYEDVFDKIMGNFKEKLPIDFVESFKNASAGNFQLKFTIDFTLPEPFDMRVGPQVINVGDYITKFADTSFSNILRLILLCGVCIYFIVSVLGVIFSV